MGKRKRHNATNEEASWSVQRRKTPEPESDGSTDTESVEISGPQPESHDRVRAYKGASDDEEFSDSSESASSEHGSSSGEEEADSEDEGLGSTSSEKQLDEDQLEEEPDISSDDDLSADDIVDERSTISFGALAKAQSQLSQNERSNHDRSTQHTTKPTDDVDFEAEALERKAGKKDNRDFNRQSKHAPAEVSSKKAVSRKRSVVPIHKINVRDPRFDLTAGKVNENQIKKNYAFLSEYRDNEIKELKIGIRKTKDPKAKAIMEAALKSMESRRRTEQLNEQRQGIVREFRKKEAKKVKEGKKPFFLKNSEVKKRALEERLKAMKSRDRTKVIERRRKKSIAKERKDMPLERRI